MSDRYRRATMGTLRVAFLSGAVLELAATLGIALVAVTVGVRLVDGGLGFEAGLTVLVLAPELYAPLRNLAAQFHASADGAAVAGRMLDLIDARPTVSHGRRRRRTCARRRSGSRTWGSATPAGRYRRCRGSTSSWSRVRRSLWSGRADPERARSPPCCFDCPSPARAASPQEAPTSLGLRRRTGAGSWHGCRSGRRCCVGRSRRTSGSATLPQPTTWSGKRPRWPVPASSYVSCRAATTRLSATGVVLSPPGRPSGSRWRRAFLRDAPFVVLDEPTANLDPASAEIVADAIDQLGANRTVLLIVHRPELAAPCRPRRPARQRSGRGTTRGGGRLVAVLRRLLALSGIARSRILVSAALGTLTVVFGVALMAFAGYLISRAAERPAILSLTTAIVAVRFFGLARPDRAIRRQALVARPRATGARACPRPVLRANRAARSG